MGKVSKKLGLLKYSFGLVIIIGIARFAIDTLNYDILMVSPVITSLVAGVIFAIAVIYTGTLTDYKESEKIPGELATAITALYEDVCMLPTLDPETVRTFRHQLRDLHQVIVGNFVSNAWDTGKIRDSCRFLNESVSSFAVQNAAPPILVKLRNELTTIDRLSNRIKQIKDTDFIPAAYALAEVSVGLIILIMLFIKNESTIEAILLLSSLTVISTGLLFLIKDMDDPFEVGEGSSADVDLTLLFELEKYLKSEEKI